MLLYQLQWLLLVSNTSSPPICSLTDTDSGISSREEWTLVGRMGWNIGRFLGIFFLSIIAYGVAVVKYA